MDFYGTEHYRGFSRAGKFVPNSISKAKFPHEEISSKLVPASLVTQLVKNLPAMQETWVRSLGWDDPLEEGMATHSSILAQTGE